MANCVVASNRGPVEHRVDAAGTLTERWSAGGLSTMLLGSVGGPGTAWVVATASEADRHAAPTTEDGSSYEQHITLPNGTVLLRTIVVGEALYNNYYGQVANETLWFLHHHMFDTVRQPVFDSAFDHAWRGYLEVNGFFADVCAEEVEQDGQVLLQDY